MWERKKGLDGWMGGRGGSRQMCGLVGCCWDGMSITSCRTQYRTAREKKSLEQEKGESGIFATAKTNGTEE